MLLHDKKIVVAVTGSIAIYKTLELIRLYIKAGAKVKVIMTEASKKFITPLTFEAISQHKVLEECTENWDKSSDYNHIDIGKWADILVIAPCSASTINKMAHGIADNLLTQTVLAYSKEILLAPAANTNMLLNPITQESVQKLQARNFTIISSVVKELACKDVGDGAMAEPSDIFYATARALLKDGYWENRKVVLSGGGTVEKIDDVRYISNFSSGKMASSLALALYCVGADVHIISSRGHENLPKAIKKTTAYSSASMYQHLEESIKDAKKTASKKPYLFMVAAVSDYLPDAQKGKLKKQNIGKSWNLALHQNMDILSSLDKSELFCVGFKAEMDETIAFESAQRMLEEKKLDAVCLNLLGETNTFGSNENAIDVLTAQGSKSFKAEKLMLSFSLLEYLHNEFSRNE